MTSLYDFGLSGLKAGYEGVRLNGTYLTMNDSCSKKFDPCVVGCLQTYKSRARRVCEL